MFRIGFVPIVLVYVAIGLTLHHFAFVKPPLGPLFEGYLNSCIYSQSNPFYSFICIVEPFFAELVADDVGKSMITVFGASYMVMSTYLFMKGGHGGGSALFTPLITIMHMLAGQALGAGIVGPILVPTLLALSKTLEPAIAPLPSPPTYAYTVTVLALQLAVGLLYTGLMSVSTAHANWPYMNYAFQAFPLLFLPLAFIPRAPKAQNNAQPPPTISVTVFTACKYLYAPLWWISLARGLNGYYRKNQGFSLPSYFIVLDFSGFVLTFLGMYAVDAVAGDAPATISLGGLLLRMVIAGPASTMAAYYEAKEGQAVQSTRGGHKRKA
ncbi:hypothetical protein B0H19DRAFT_1289476 [Mycena capillaripes]|nr:hypothetical protein B0H19DRAFT_1289476 [Mycena capillaripes]